MQQRRLAEERLAIFRRFVEAATQGFGMADLDGRITYVNPCLARLLGASRPEDMLGKHVSTYYPAEYQVRRQTEILPALCRRGYWQGEQGMVFADGQMHPTLHTIFPVRDDSGEMFCTATVISDITELKRAEETLRQSEEKYRHLVETTDTGFLILDAQGRVLDANAEYVRLSGHHELREIRGRSVVEWTAPYDAQRNAREVQRCLQQGHVRHLELDYIHADGTVTPLEINASVVNTSQGVRVLSLCRDISERKQTAKKLQREQQALRRMVLASDHERRLMTYELHDGVAQQLLGALMHFQAQEPRRDRSSKAAQDAFRDGLDALRQASTELRRLMNWLRTPVLDRFGLAEAIADVIAQLRSAPGAPKIDYRQEVTFQRLEPTLENSLFRIAQEALTNACRHSHSEQVRATLVQQGDEVTLEVRDWGLGFDTDAVQENRFGLEGIRERSRLLGGELSIQSRPGEGTVVRVKVPLVEAADQKEPAAKE